MSEQPTPYNQIDFVVQAPRFRIAFSYVDSKGVSFVREYLLRLLKLMPCKPEQIAQYFGFDQHETEVALADFENQKWIKWQTDGTIALSEQGLAMFDGETPQIPTLKEKNGEYTLELLDSNFLNNQDCDEHRHQALELNIDAQTLSERSEIAQKMFQARFKQLVEDDIIELDSSDAELYKIDAVEPKGAPKYFRFTQQFELLPETGEAKERHDVAQLIHQDNIQKAITEALAQFSGSDNLRELRDSMNELDDDDTLKVLFGGGLDFVEFLKIYQKYEQQKGLYFLGQIYHQEPLFKKIDEIIKKLKKQSHNMKKCYWLAPSDVYWGKQRKIHEKLSNLINQSKEKYDFRLYLPLPAEWNKREKEEWEFQFKDTPKKHLYLYGFHEGFLNGNTEILFLENEFAVVCYHAKLSAYPVSLPIGFMVTQPEQVRQISEIVKGYLNRSIYDDDSQNETYDFGMLCSKK